MSVIRGALKKPLISTESRATARAGPMPMRMSKQPRAGRRCRIAFELAATYEVPRQRSQVRRSSLTPGQRMAGNTLSKNHSPVEALPGVRHPEIIFPVTAP
jgi:hypothetical protein